MLLEQGKFCHRTLVGWPIPEALRIRSPRPAACQPLDTMQLKLAPVNMDCLQTSMVLNLGDDKVLERPTK